MLWEVIKQFSCFSLQIIYELVQKLPRGCSQIFTAYHQRLPAELPTRRLFKGGQFWCFIHQTLGLGRMDKNKTGKTPKIKTSKPNIGPDIMIDATCAFLSFVLDVDGTSL